MGDKKEDKKEVTYDDIIKNIAKNYKGLEKSIVNQLLFQVPNHRLTEGTYREEVWMELFERIIPKKYSIAQGVFIIDSYGAFSKEVDLAIYDEMYTPYIFNYEGIKFIPIEAVAAVVQCKSHLKSNKFEGLKDWVNSIYQLKTSMNSVARMATKLIDNQFLYLKDKDDKSVGGPRTDYTTQTSTRPITILCSISNTAKIREESEFDIILYTNEKNQYLIKKIRNDFKTLADWNDLLNHYNLDRYDAEEKAYREAHKQNSTIGSNRTLKNLEVVNSDGRENVILSLVFQLNQLLMLINNPMLFPHEAYAVSFNNILNLPKEKTDE